MSFGQFPRLLVTLLLLIRTMMIDFHFYHVCTQIYRSQVFPSCGLTRCRPVAVDTLWFPSWHGAIFCRVPQNENCGDAYRDVKSVDVPRATITSPHCNDSVRRLECQRRAMGCCDHILVERRTSGGRLSDHVVVRQVIPVTYCQTI